MFLNGNHATLPPFECSRLKFQKIKTIKFKIKEFHIKLQESAYQELFKTQGTNLGTRIMVYKQRL